MKQNPRILSSYRNKKLKNCKTGLDSLEEGCQDSTGGVLSVADVEEYFGISHGTMYKLINSGELPSFRVGSRRLFYSQTIKNYILNKEKEGNYD